MIHIGEEIRKVVFDKRVTVVWLAQQLGCSRTNVYKIYEKSSIDTNTMLRLSKILKYDFFALYKEEIDKGRTNL